MNLAFRLKLAQQTAEKLVRDEKLESLPVDVLALAASRGITVQAKPATADGVSGVLARHGDEFGILFATFIKSPGFQRFSIAHELGHYFLPGHIDHILPESGQHESHAEFRSPDPYEQEADSFAVGLLMPTNPFQKELRRFDDGLDAIEGMADLCGTSLTATAIRYAELTKAACAIVVSTGQNVDYCRLSQNIKLLKGLHWIKKGTSLPSPSLTASFNANTSSIAGGDREECEVDIRDWFGGTRKVTAREEVVGLGSYGRALTVVTCPDIEGEAYGEDGGEESEEDIAERWTPRFRK